MELVQRLSVKILARPPSKQYRPPWIWPIAPGGSAMIWMTAAPGCEEALISGIASIVGDDVPITGGSSADNTVTGQLKQFTHEQI